MAGDTALVAMLANYKERRRSSRPIPCRDALPHIVSAGGECAVDTGQRVARTTRCYDNARSAVQVNDGRVGEALVSLQASSTRIYQNARSS
jgi:hypothetical protein